MCVCRAALTRVATGKLAPKRTHLHPPGAVLATWWLWSCGSMKGMRWHECVKKLGICCVESQQYATHDEEGHWAKM